MVLSCFRVDVVGCKTKINQRQSNILEAVPMSAIGWQLFLKTQENVVKFQIIVNVASTMDLLDNVY